MKVGQGPGEYTHVYDVMIDTLERTINFLSPFCFIYSYNYSGQFIKKIDLPVPPNAYSKFIDFDSETYIVWAYVGLNNNELGNISFISKQTNQIINSFWKGKDFEAVYARFPFWEYDNKTYFSSSLTNKVYQITVDGYHLSYKWDFGKFNIDKYRESEVFKINKRSNVNEKSQRISQDIKTSDNLYYFSRKFENNTYYYAQIVFKNYYKTAPHIFYNKIPYSIIEYIHRLSSMMKIFKVYEIFGEK
jgi:hypothetical protein